MGTTKSFKSFDKLGQNFSVRFLEERGPPQDVAPIHGDVRRRTWSRGHLLHLRLGWRSVDEVLPNLQQEVRQAGLQRSQWELKKPFDNNYSDNMQTVIQIMLL